METQLTELVESLLYEGYALYPYTPGATKNATPTPFGIVYPPAYAEENRYTFDHVRVECILAADEDAELTGTVRFLQQAGDRHQGTARTLALGPVKLADLLDDRTRAEFAHDGEQLVSGRGALRADRVGEGLFRVRCCVHNSTEVEPALGRGDALRSSLISTHVVIETSSGRFISPLERKGPAGEAVAECESVNSFPVLASEDDRAILGAAIVLPDHPKMSPESLGNLFDNTEIEEALLLHVRALSDEERERIAEQDPAVRDMIAKADEATDEDLMRLHGLMRPSDFLSGVEDPGPPPEPGHPNPGEPSMEVARGTIYKGGKVILHPKAESRDPFDVGLRGRTATIERIYYDMDNEVHVGVTIDGDASQEIYRETGRYIFFKGDELEPVPADDREGAHQ